MILDRGWVYVRSDGSHRQYARPGYANITIAFHPGDMRTKTQQSVMKIAGITREEL